MYECEYKKYTTPTQSYLSGNYSASFKKSTTLTSQTESLAWIRSGQDGDRNGKAIGQSPSLHSIMKVNNAERVQTDPKTYVRQVSRATDAQASKKHVVISSCGHNGNADGNKGAIFPTIRKPKIGSNLKSIDIEEKKRNNREGLKRGTASS